MIILLLLVISSCFLVCCLMAKRWSSLAFVNSPRLLAFSLCVVASAGIVTYLVQSSLWRTSSEIAWTGVRAQIAGTELKIGGDSGSSVTGWPNGTFFPQLRVSSSGELSIEGGGGFVSAGHQYLNGRGLPIDAWVPVRNMRVVMARKYFFGRQILVFSESNEELARFSVSGGARDAVVAMPLLIAPSAIKLRSEGGGVKAHALEQWAAGLRMLIPSSGDGILVAAPEDNATRTNLSLPAEIQIRWQNSASRVLVREEAHHVVADFLPPWRMSSPLPPKDGKNDTGNLTITAHALPGDTAFVLPLGGTLKDFRADLTLQGDRFPSCIEETNAEDSYATAPRAAGPELLGVKCTQIVDAGPTGFRFSLVSDLPRLSALLLIVAVPLIILAWALRFCLELMREEDRWTICGITLTTYLLLLFRLALAMRYASDPAYLDSLALGGVGVAAAALVVTPILLLMVARIWRDQYFDLAADKMLSKVRKQILGIGLTAATGVVVQLFLTRGMWPNAPASYSTVGTTTGLLMVVVKCAAAFVIFAFFVATQYLLSKEKFDNYDAKTTGYLKTINKLSFGIWSIFRRATTELGPNTWRSVERAPQRMTGGRGPVLKLSFGRQVLRVLLMAAVVLIVTALLTFSNLFGSQKWLQEVIAPLLLCWIPACVLIGARKIFRPDASSARVAPLGAAAIILITIAASVFMFPVAVRDVGGIAATMCVFIPVAMILLAGIKPWPVAIIPFATIAGIGVLAWAAYMQFNVTLGPLSMVGGGTAGARVLIWKHGTDAERLIPWARMGKGEATIPVNWRRLSDAIEHSEENRMMAHEGGFFGLGFGKAPEHQSRIRVDTLQYDSTFSFFVVSEDGVAGGLCLLMLYFTPLLYVLISARQLFDVGHAVAAVVASAFVGAALTHANMNLGALPFTGRNLPLLSVNSFSDLVLWSILLPLLIQALLWRVTGHARVFGDQDSVISASRPPGQEPLNAYTRACAAILAVPLILLFIAGFTSTSIARNQRIGEGFDWSGLLRTVDGLINQRKLRYDGPSRRIVTGDNTIIPPDTVLGQEIELFNSLSDDEKSDGATANATTTFRQDLQKIRSTSEYDAAFRRLRTSSSRSGDRARPSMFVVQPSEEWADAAETVRYFDAEPRLAANYAYNSHVIFRTENDRRDFPEVSEGDTAAGAWRLAGGGIEFTFPNRPATPREDRAIILGRLPNRSGLRILSDTSPGSARANLFLRFAPVGKATAKNEGLAKIEIRNDGVYVSRHTVKLAFSHLSVTKEVPLNSYVKLDEGDMLEVPAELGEGLQPRFTLRRTSHGMLIGPALVRGTWRPAYNPDPQIPWIGELAGALQAKWSGLSKEQRDAFGTLTFDRSLQAAAQSFAATKGRLRHEQLLAGRPNSKASSAMPPRVAMAIIDLPKGEVLAMGGWPRMAPGTSWIDGPNGDVPSADWIENRAPASVRRRYGSDRNFDRILMGSSTKPIFASVALSIHKSLDKQLAVRGGAGDEDDVFGIRVGKAWHVEASRGKTGDWCDFASYLTRSDNRYHLRLGFLALAAPAPGNLISEETAQQSPSSTESIDGGQSVWHRYPQFLDVGFDHNNPGVLRNLANTSFAKQLSSMYGIGIHGADVLHRYSFWTGKESDDRLAPGMERSSWSTFSTITPESPQFSLEHIETPRTFVSLLLGGDENMWSNVDFAGAFSTAVGGLAVTPHVTGAKTESQRVEFRDIALKLRPGLAGVVEPGGTAYPEFSPEARKFLSDLNGYNVYAKTGTLAESATLPSTSRLVMTFVKFGKDGTISNGLALSLVVERGYVGLAAKLMGEFLVENSTAIRSRLR